MLRLGVARWAGGKPLGARRPPRVRGSRSPPCDRGSRVRLYLDTSALVKLYVEEEGATTVRTASDEADVITTSALASAEARAAYARRPREGALSSREYRHVIHDFDEDWPRLPRHPGYRVAHPRGRAHGRRASAALLRRHSP